jgi:hypothetical protein
MAAWGLKREYSNIGKEEVKLPLFTDDKMLYLKDLKKKKKNS